METRVAAICMRCLSGSEEQSEPVPDLVVGWSPANESLQFRTYERPASKGVRPFVKLYLKIYSMSVSFVRYPSMSVHINSLTHQGPNVTKGKQS
jgi:hypothetical protein